VSEDPKVYDSRAFFGPLGSDWRTRLEEIDAYKPVVSREGVVLPEKDKVSKLYADVFSDWGGLSTKDTPKSRAFYDAFTDYQGRIADELRQRGATPIRDRFSSFSSSTGLGDYEPVAEYNNPGAFEAAAHEIYAHQIPFEEGFAPDYRDFFAGTDTQGNPVVIKANTAFPLNENLAEIGEKDIGHAFRGLSLQDPSSYRDVISGRNTDSFELSARKDLDPTAKTLLPARVELALPRNYVDREGSIYEAVEPENTRLAGDLTEAGRLYQQKYVTPASDQMKGLISSQFPGLGASNKTGTRADIMPSRYIRFLQELDKLYGGSAGDIGNFFYGLDPISMAASAVPEVAGNIKRVPASLLPGVADLIPSPEAIRTGYTQGPVEMGKQMAQEFAQSLPYAAGAATLLSMPAVAPLAPGIGAGMVGTTGARALNEVVRQETGKSLLQRIQETAGAAGGDTTVIGRPRQPIRQSPSTYVTPEITQMSPEAVRQMNAQRNAQKNENELQRRLRLAGEARQRDPYDFGVTELLFGR
jgi:hypothetical protein